MAASPASPRARVQQIIRRPAEWVYTAFVEPHWLTQFWLARASGPLVMGRKIRWEFKVHGAADDVEVIALEPGRQIKVRWSDQSTTEWMFDASTSGETVVTIEQAGFSGAEAADQALDATEGYTIVVCDLKVLLERGIAVGLCADKAALIERAMAETKK